MHRDHLHLDSLTLRKTSQQCLKGVVDPLPSIPAQQISHIANSVCAESKGDVQILYATIKS